MKKRRVLLLSLMLSVFFCACSSNRSAEVPLKGTIETTGKEVAEEDAQLSFGSIEEFVEAVKITESNVNDRVNLATLREFAVPTGIPESYQLYKVTVSDISIGFWYLPGEYLAGEDTMLEGELNQKHFLFIYPRTDVKFETVVGQLYGMSGQMISDRYYASSKQVVWDEDGKTYMMYFPADALGESTAENHLRSVFATTEENLTVLCATEKISIE